MALEHVELKIEHTCRFCKNKETVEVWHYPDLYTMEETLAREEINGEVFVCDTCKRLIKEIISNELR